MSHVGAIYLTWKSVTHQLSFPVILHVFQQFFTFVPVSAIIFFKISLFVFNYPAAHLSTHHRCQIAVQSRRRFYIKYLYLSCLLNSFKNWQSFFFQDNSRPSSLSSQSANNAIEDKFRIIFLHKSFPEHKLLFVNMGHGGIGELHQSGEMSYVKVIAKLPFALAVGYPHLKGRFDIKEFLRIISRVGATGVME